MAERIGDQCVNTAKLTLLGGDAPADAAEISQCLKTMSAEALELVEDAAAALRDRDLELARALAVRDKSLNDLNRACFQHALAHGESESVRAWAMSSVLSARALERIGDNAVDIGVHVIFAVTGEWEGRADNDSTATASLSV